jgi:hypothetical protein
MIIINNDEPSNHETNIGFKQIIVIIIFGSLLFRILGFIFPNGIILEDIIQEIAIPEIIISKDTVQRDTVQMDTTQKDTAQKNIFKNKTTPTILYISEFIATDDIVPSILQDSSL